MKMELESSEARSWYENESYMYKCFEIIKLFGERRIAVDDRNNSALAALLRQ